ncbi:dolichyl-phosphate-mannose-protein mannosyltransferase family [Candidatus Termititenax persephonae]|uniref:Dolichyl-phosphate-mannose-protein mannosyltransferase family n=1 Tax=Candidatus Termititenax persephonae TaxID=2218525 RepID=A0A388TER1_9BACT|nr:dolichyl-phosphate-mannose-protein mannosyltransferase family [Candidatus Termititenax persephonae]
MNFFKQLVNHKYYWLFILLGGFFLRALAGLYWQHQQLPDYHSQYAPTAEALAAGLGYGMAKPPGFILFLAALVKIFGQTSYIYPSILVQSVVALLLCYFLYKITTAIFNSETAGRWAAGLGAFYPWLIFYATQLSMEHWFVFWVVLSIYCSIIFDQKRDWPSAVLLGLVFGFTSWVRTVFLPYVVLAVAFFLFRKIPWPKIVMVGLLVLCFIGSWGTYNYCRGGEWSFTGGNADHNLYLGLNPLNKTGGGIWGEEAPPLEEIYKIMNSLPPDKRQTWYKDEVKKFVRENPRQVLILAVKKMYIFWRPYPRAPQYTNPLTSTVIFCSFVPLVLLAAYTLWIFRQAKNYVLLTYPLLYIVQLNAIHLVFAGSLVYRFPIEPLLICLAAYGLDNILRRVID